MPSIPAAKARLLFTECLRTRMNPKPSRASTNTAQAPTPVGARAKSAKAVLPAGVNAIDQRKDPADEKAVVFVAYADAAKSKVLGYAAPGVSASGYGGTIRLMVGLTAERNVVSYQVLAANETPGLGAKCNTDEHFYSQFKGFDPTSKILSVKKDGGDIDAITASTITSRAYTLAVKNAVEALKTIKGE